MESQVLKIAPIANQFLSS